MQVKLLLLTLSIMVLLSGCGSTPQTPEAALPVAEDFLIARSKGDAGAVYDLLTEGAREAMERPAVSSWVRGESVRFAGLGAPIARDAGWIQVPVQDLVITRDGHTVRWPEARLTLRHDGDRWQVAWADPLLYDAAIAYANSNYTQALELGRTITEIDPYHYRGALEQHFANRGLRRFREAEVWLIAAREAALGPQLADVEDAWARFKLELQQPADAATAARRALDHAQTYIPETYSRRWQVDTMVVLGRALLQSGDRAGAQAIVAQAQELDPLNGALAVFRQQLAAPVAPAESKPKSP